MVFVATHRPSLRCVAIAPGCYPLLEPLDRDAAGAAHPHVPNAGDEPTRRLHTDLQRGGDTVGTKGEGGHGWERWPGGGKENKSPPGRWLGSARLRGRVSWSGEHLAGLGDGPIEGGGEVGRASGVGMGSADEAAIGVFGLP